LQRELEICEQKIAHQAMKGDQFTPFRVMDLEIIEFNRIFAKVGIFAEFWCVR